MVNGRTTAQHERRHALAHLTSARFSRVAALLVAALLSLGIAAAVSADGPSGGSQTSSPPPTPSPRACAVERVHLNGAQPATHTCLVTAADQDKAEPGPVQGSLPIGVCYPNDLHIYQDSNFDGKVLCFYGEGMANLSSYYIHGLPLFLTWNDRISSFETGGYQGKFYEHSNSGGARLVFAPNQRVRIGSSWWNDRISSLCLGSATFMCP
jgi:hypothetical protein